MSDDKLIFTGFNNNRNTEMSYIKLEVFNILMANGFIRWDGMWIQHPQLWPIFMRGLADGRV